tara:strand:- start:19 stop:600 length:582 start_codon:yes stop_codon:yes gene_type:complete
VKRLLLILIITFSFETLTKADDIRDFEIEGMSIGDSALDYFSKSTLDKGKELSWYDTKIFTPIRDIMLTNSKIYESYQIVIKTGDKNYKIQGIEGFIFYRNNDFDKCLSQLDSISNDIKKLFTKINSSGKQTYKHSYDKSGKTLVTAIHLTLKNGDEVRVNCVDWAKKYSFLDQLRISIFTKEYAKFLETAYN